MRGAAPPDPVSWGALPRAAAVIFATCGMDSLPSPLPTAVRELIRYVRPPFLRRWARDGYGWLQPRLSPVARPALPPHLTDGLVERSHGATGRQVGLFVHGAAGTGLLNAVVATRVGADLIATAVYPLALTLHRVSGESLVDALHGLLAWRHPVLRRRSGRDLAGARGRPWPDAGAALGARGTGPRARLSAALHAVDILAPIIVILLPGPVPRHVSAPLRRGGRARAHASPGGRLGPVSTCGGRPPPERVPRGARVAEERLELRARDPVREEVVLHEDVERRLPRDERGVAEHLPLLEELERLAVALEPHRTLADHEQVLERRTVAPRDALARGVVHDLHRRRGVLEARRGEGIEGRGGAEERHRIERLLGDGGTGGDAGNVESMFCCGHETPLGR